MVYGQKPKYYKQSQLMQRNTLTLYIDHMLLVEGERSTTIPMSGRRLVNKGGNPEYLWQQEYGTIANGVGENPLNGKGMTAIL